MTASIHYVNGQEAACIKLGMADKIAFLGMSPEQMQHIGLRAAGGAAGGAGIGAIAGGEDNRMQGALAGGAAGALGAGGLSAAQKNLELRSMLRHFAETPAARRAHMPEADRVLEGLSGLNAGGTMSGGAALGAAPAMLAGRATRDE